MRRAKPWRPAASPAAGNSAIRCVPSTVLRAVALPAVCARLALTSGVTACAGCGGGAGSGVEAYIVLGIRACALARCS